MSWSAIFKLKKKIRQRTDWQVSEGREVGEVGEIGEGIKPKKPHGPASQLMGIPRGKGVESGEEGDDEW